MQRTHHFILEVWEAMYRSIIAVYETQQSESSKHEIVQLQNKFVQLLSDGKFKRLTQDIYINSTVQQRNFTDFVQKMAQTDDTWKFWLHSLKQN